MSMWQKIEDYLRKHIWIEPSSNYIEGRKNA